MTTTAGHKSVAPLPPRGAAGFVAFWPILDPRTPFRTLKGEAENDLPVLLHRARARLIGRGRWQIVPSQQVAGSGRVTDTVLLFSAPATAAPRPKDDE